MLSSKGFETPIGTQTKAILQSETHQKRKAERQPAVSGCASAAEDVGIEFWVAKMKQTRKLRPATTLRGGGTARKHDEGT